MLKVAITGPDGLIGSRITKLLKDQFEFIPLIQAQFDITSENQVAQTLSSLDFDLLLHLAAYTNVDAAEKQKELAFNINVNGTKNIFQACQKRKKKIVYISTDFVFDGENPPFFENSIPHPISYYGQTKYDGERVLENQAMIVRLAYPYRASFDLKKDFVRSIRSLLEQGKSLSMVTDSEITPTFIDDLVYALSHLLNNYDNNIYHLVGADSLSPYNAGKLIAKIYKLNDSLIQPITYDEYFKNSAKRPKYSVIKSQNNSFYKMKTFEEGLYAML